MALSEGALPLLALVLLSIVMLWSPVRLQTSHYEALGVQRNASNDQIQAAYARTKASLDSKDDIKLQKVERAFYVLSNTFRRRNYDNFGVDSERGEVQSDLIPSVTVNLTVQNFKTVLESGDAWLIQIYSIVDSRSSQFSAVWERLANVLDGQIKLGRVELGEIELAKLLSETTWLGTQVFRQGIPELVGFPSECKRLDCLMRYSKELSYESILDWTATDFLNLPRIPYYSSHNLIPDFLQKSGLHKVKVLIFSSTGERALPYMREVAKQYSDYAAFGCVLWRQDESFVWKNRLGVESAPAVVVLKDPGMQPVIFHGKMNRTGFLQLVVAHRTHVVPQLRSITASDLGCDTAGHSMAGKNALTWYCVVAAGKPGYRLDQLRSTMRSVQEELAGVEVDEEFLAAATAFGEKRLSLAWLDGTAQKRFCYYILASETVHSTCGAKQYAEEEDVPRIAVLRFRRNGEESQEDLASVLVARYNGTDEVAEILLWISNTVRDGETQEIPFFKTKAAPALVPEDTTTSMLYGKRSAASQVAIKVLNQGKYLILDTLKYFLPIGNRFLAILVVVVSIYIIYKTK